jgi:hypothetical protein
MVRKYFIGNFRWRISAVRRNVILFSVTLRFSPFHLQGHRADAVSLEGELWLSSSDSSQHL